ncbi:MAG TPA: ABC transporter ATP-binding protein [Cellulomonas sp.]
MSAAPTGTGRASTGRTSASGTAHGGGVRVAGLRVEVHATGEAVLPGIDLDVPDGQVIGLAGETGSGKSTLALALLGHVSPGLRQARGTVEVAGTRVTGAAPGVLRSVRGRVVAYVPQDPSSALNPSMRVGAAFAEVLRAHGVRAVTDQEHRMATLFAAVGLPATPDFLRRYPHELSGGQKQRVAIAIAFALEPRVVVMDEPTTGLDVSTTQAVVALVRDLSARTGSSVVFVSHDLRLLLGFTDRLVVMRSGEIVEDLPAATFAVQARHPYARALLAALPGGRSASGGAEGRPFALELAAVGARYGATPVTHDVSLRLPVGECLAVVGESGSGKTTLARCVAGFHPDYDGDVLVDDVVVPRAVAHRSAGLRRSVQYVFQNPFASLNPRRAVGDSVALAATSLTGAGRRAAWDATRTLFERVGLREDHLRALPHELSGGQCQRVALARALVVDPRVLVCDEVTSSLDVSVQAEIVALLQELQRERGLSMLFITHDLALAQTVAGRTAVLLQGQVVEQGASTQVLRDPRHPYTRRLVEASRVTHGA